jgi:hypothetical protein
VQFSIGPGVRFRVKQFCTLSVLFNFLVAEPGFSPVPEFFLLLNHISLDH